MTGMRSAVLRAALGFAVAVFGQATMAQAQAADPFTSYVRYDAAGRVVGTIAPDPDGGGPLPHPATRTTYDAQGLVVLVESGTLSTWRDETVEPKGWDTFNADTSVATEYDAMRRKVWEKAIGSDGVAVGLTQYSYDALGRLECTAVRMAPSQYDNLPPSACTPWHEGNYGPDRITKTIYDAAGQVRQVRVGVGSDVEAAEVTYSYTPNGKIEHLVDANGNRTTYEYDGFDRLKRWVFPDRAGAATYDDSTPDAALASAGASAMPGMANADYEEYAYDANGNRTQLRKRDGSLVDYAYDALNRMTAKALTPPSGSSMPANWHRSVHYAYDLRDLQVAARFDGPNGAEGIFTRYDGFGRLESTTDTVGGRNYSLAYEHDRNGNRTAITHPDGKRFGYAYDGLDRLDIIADPGAASLFNPDYDAAGRLTQIYRNGAAIDTTLGYDTVGRLQSLRFTDVNNSAQVHWGFARNPASQILSETRYNDSYAFPATASVERDYEVNGLNQYTGTELADGSNARAYCFDANGNLTADGTYIYRYDVENRLTQMRQQLNADCGNLDATGAWKAGFAYDPLGRLYRINEGLNSTRLLHDGDALIAEYRQGDGAMLRRYVHGPDIGADDPLVWYEGAGTARADRRYLHTDARGSIVLVADAEGGQIAINAYDEYGIPTTSNNGFDIETRGRFRYTGQTWLPELGMYYYKARIYSPTLGRFMQTDPIGYEDQFNLYAYVANDPVNGIDPSGTREATVDENHMLRTVFGKQYKALPMYMYAMPRSIFLPHRINFSPDDYSKDFSREADPARVNTFWHEQYHAFEHSIGFKTWGSMAADQIKAGFRTEVYKWDPSKGFNDQHFEARASAFAGCMTTGTCSRLEGMSVSGRGTSLTFKNGEFTLTQERLGSRIPERTTFQPKDVMREEEK